MATTMELEAEIKKEPDEDNSANEMDKQTLAAVLLFLKKNNLRVRCCYSCCILTVISH